MKGKRLSMAVMLLLLLCPLAQAETVSVDDARALALQHFQGASHAQGRRGVAAQGGEVLSAPYTLSGEGEAALYIFNREGGGYVVVSAESDSKRQVLAWSDEGSYDPAQLPAPMKAVLDNYIKGIRQLRHATPAERAQLNSAVEAAAQAPTLRRMGDLPASVEPLLGDIAWHQRDPYNRRVPTYEQDGETYHYPAGCVATAIAQVMMYHRWPAQGRGMHSYQWNDQTLEADFSQSTYRWDLMLPTYGNVVYTEEQADAVALLVHDIGVSVNMDYQTGGSGAAFYGSRMVEFFDYDKSMRTLEGNYCSTDDWEGELRKELAEARPVLCDGGSSHGAHEFVCDGYNAEGLFHYNFGWGAITNGWFASTATGYDSSPTIDYGLTKNQGGKGALSLHSKDDFMWNKATNRLECSLSVTCSGLDDNTALDLEMAYALLNVQTGEITYTVVVTGHKVSMGITVMPVPQSLPDGTYQIYPVGRIAGEEWQTFFHNPMRQLVVDLTVSGGEMTWSNNHIVDYIDDGVVEIDGIYYTLNDETNEATVTRRNERGNCYSGDVVIPAEVVYGGHTYLVTAIGKSAFDGNTNLASVAVGQNVKVIEDDAFNLCGLNTITFAEGSHLQSIGTFAFNGCSQLKEIHFPDGLLEIGLAAFQSCSSLTTIYLPSSVTSIQNFAFNVLEALQTVYVEWLSFAQLSAADLAFGYTPLQSVTLVVPNGYADLYRSHSVWSQFNIQESDEPVEDPLEGTSLYVLGCDGNWNPAQPSATLAYRTGDKCYAGDITVSDVDGGYGYFCIGTNLGNDSSDWGTFNANRLGAPAGDYLLASGSVTTYLPGADASFKAAAGTHHLVIEIYSNKIFFDCTDGIQPTAIETANAATYDLYGRRVTQLQPGTLYIRNGRKFIAQ